MRSRSMCALVVGFAACSSASPPPAQPVPPAPPDAAVAIVDAPPPDIRLEAPAYVFRFTSAARTETWSLWFAHGAAVLDVQPVGGAITQYRGSATEAATLLVEVAGPTAKMKLDCKRTKRELAAPCDPAAKPPKAKAKAPATTTIDALDCFVEGFKEPMPFGPTPGIEYVADGVCAGYRSL